LLRETRFEPEWVSQIGERKMPSVESSRCSSRRSRLGGTVKSRKAALAGRRKRRTRKLVTGFPAELFRPFRVR
jgi:hypothetical protein